MGAATNRVNLMSDVLLFVLVVFVNTLKLYIICFVVPVKKKKKERQHAQKEGMEGGGEKEKVYRPPDNMTITNT